MPVDDKRPEDDSLAKGARAEEIAEAELITDALAGPASGSAPQSPPRRQGGGGAFFGGSHKTLPPTTSDASQFAAAGPRDPNALPRPSHNAHSPPPPPRPPINLRPVQPPSRARPRAPGDALNGAHANRSI